MIECPDCGGYNTACHVERDEDGDLLFTEWRCRDCGAEWVEDSGKAAGALKSEIELLRVELGNRPAEGAKPVDVWPDRW